MGYDEQYAKVKALFGTAPETVVKRFAERLSPGSVVLDIGAGQGRNARYLAEQGITVHALEPSRVAAATLEHLAAEKQLDIEVFGSTFERFDPPIKAYAGILVFGLVPDLEWPAINELVRKIDDWGRQGTLVWLTGFATHDPAYAQYEENWARCGANSFRGPDGQTRTYLEPGQILSLFEQYSVLHHWEGLGPEHRHGDGPPERHGRFEAVLRRVLI